MIARAKMAGSSTFVRISVIAGVVFAVAYAADWASLRIRIAHGTAFRTIIIHKFLQTPLKGQMEEYDFLGDLSLPCSRSLFPQAGNPPCWWTERHTTEWQ